MTRGIRDLKNLGDRSGELLAAVGIETEADLRELGAVAAYTKVKAAFPRHVTLSMLDALQGALMDLPMKELPTWLREELRRQV